MSERRPVSKEVRRKVYDKYAGHCAYCGLEITESQMQVDHIVPIYWYNGKDELENYNPACRMCNFYKGTLTIEKFREQLEKIQSRLEKEYIYRLAKNYGLVIENRNKIKFYFETLHDTTKTHNL